MIRIFHDTRESVIADTRIDAPPIDTLWLDADQIREATGWDWKPQGLCREDTCMPVPRVLRSTDQPMVDGDRLDLAAFGRYAGWPVVHDESGRVWVLGESAAHRADALSSLQAPDFELPDLEGRMHRLSDLRGQRVFLSTWASW